MDKFVFESPDKTEQVALHYFGDGVVYESGYVVDSGEGKSYASYHSTKADAIAYMISYGYLIMQRGWRVVIT